MRDMNTEPSGVSRKAKRILDRLCIRADFRRLLFKLGCPDYRTLSSERIAINNPEIEKKVGMVVSIPKPYGPSSWMAWKTFARTMGR